MRHSFFMVWDAPDGKGWTGPHDDIAEAKRAVPESATASALLVPIAAMTPSEKRDALPILEGRSDA
jgi:hypothetical protein